MGKDIVLIKPDQDESDLWECCAHLQGCWQQEGNESQGRQAFLGLEKPLLELLCSSQK